MNTENKAKIELWDKWNSTGGPKYPHNKVVQFLLRTYPNQIDRSNIHALDLGCGGGVHMEFLTSEGFLAHGQDISQSALETTKNRLHSKGLNYESLKIGSTHEIFLKDESMNVVICIGVLECIEPTLFATSLFEILRVLKKGGKAFCLFAAQGDFRCQQSNSLQLHGYSEQEIDEAVSLIQPLCTDIYKDIYMTTYESQSMAQKEHLLTLMKK
ncbi:class I SAM-dependent methyltransferase [Acinetobacter junii]|uniref:class I SAM-dependent methyltransferase n=1 Tax=Acinetobacter junii TaxID=40215 RepID=UPI0012503C52|nr:class I SAM-dependent methyltransferase [Acinetobacter junii]MDH0718430.1 class I SAM-dependent methyltransferase [Acinetobacter junii]